MGIVGGTPLSMAFATRSRRVVVKLKRERAITGRRLAKAAELLGERFGRLRDRARGLRIQPYFGTLDDNALMRESRHALADSSGRRLYLAVECGAEDPRDVAAAIRESPDVELAYPEPPPSPPPVVFAGDDPRCASQRYLDAAPEGIGARWAWQVAGVDGLNVGFVDVEYGWTLDHEDLKDANITLVSGLNRSYRGHGTAVLGEVVAVDNTVGCVGIAPHAATMVVSQERQPDTNNPADAILQASLAMRPGDVLLLEMQTDWNGRLLPVEIEPAAFDAIKAATARGIIVVEAAGNGSADLDEATGIDGRHVLNRNSGDFADSGAIVVGAASSGVPHALLPFSNCGSRVDCFAWGENVMTCGGVDDGTASYTGVFGGTSAAAPMVAGAALLLQSWRVHTGIEAYTPQQMRDLLSRTDGNTPSADPGVEKIGVMPDVRWILERERVNTQPDAGPWTNDTTATGPAALFPRSVWLSYLALAALSAGSALLPAGTPGSPPAVRASAAPQVDFMTRDAVQLTTYAEGNAQATVLVRNDGKEHASFICDATLVDHAGAVSKVTLGQGEVEPNGVEAVTLKLPVVSTLWHWHRDLPSRGSLRLVATAKAATSEPAAPKSDAAERTVRFRDLVVPQLQPGLAEAVITGLSLLVAAILVAVNFWRRLVPVSSWPSNVPVWTPRSWGTNLAIGGGILTSLLTVAALPADTHYMARGSYQVLAPLFAALVALAPLVYGLLRSPGAAPTPLPGQRLFAFASAITLWATLGQLGVSALVFLEFEAAGAISWIAAVAILAIVLGVYVAVVLYAFRAVAGYLTAPSPTVGSHRRPWALI